MVGKKIIFTLLSLSFALGLTSCGSGYTKSNSISFYDGETSLGSISGQAGAAISDTDKATISGYESKDDYIFKGWYTASDFSSGYSYCRYYPFSDLNLYAKFLKDVTITLKNGEDVIKTYSGLQGDYITEADADNKQVRVESFPSQEQTESTFDGWGYTPEGGEFTYFDPSKDTYPATDLTLVPHFSAYPTVSFVTNIDGFTLASRKIETGTALTLTDQEKTDFNNAVTGKTASGEFKFDNWYTDEAFKNTFNFSSLISEDTTLYAHFLKKYTITFVTNLKDATDTSKDYTLDPYNYFEGETISPIVFDQTKVGDYYFSGWYEASDFTGSAFSFTKMPSKDMTLYAKFTSNPTLTIIDTFDNSQVVLTTYSPSDKVNLTSYKKTHADKSFLGFSTSIDSTGLINNYTSYLMPEADSTLYILYKDTYALTVKYVDPYGTEIGAGTIVNDPITWSSGSASIDLNTDTTVDNSIAKTVFNKLNDYSTSDDYASDSCLLTGFTDDITTTPLKPLNSSLTLNSDKTIYAIIAKKVTLTINIYLDTATTSSKTLDISGQEGASPYQDQTIAKTIIGTTEGGNVSIYGVDSTFSASAYRLNYASISDKQIDLPSNYPKDDTIIDIRLISLEE